MNSDRHSRYSPIFGENHFGLGMERGMGLLTLANTFCDLFCHIYMSPDSHMKLYLSGGSCWSACKNSKKWQNKSQINLRFPLFQLPKIICYLTRTFFNEFTKVYFWLEKQKYNSDKKASAMEKVVCQQITKFLEDNELLPKSQHGFRMEI